MSAPYFSIHIKIARAALRFESSRRCVLLPDTGLDTVTSGDLSPETRRKRIRTALESATGMRPCRLSAGTRGTGKIFVPGYVFSPGGRAGSRVRRK